MIDRRWLALLVLLGGVAFLAESCDHFPLLAGALDEDCDAPRTINTDGGSGVSNVRMSNCQAANTVCCRISAQATHTTCQYPEDCYVAPYKGQCATPVDCSDTQTCTNGTCQCTLGGPPCADLNTAVVTCCAAGQICNMGMCGSPLDGGL